MITFAHHTADCSGSLMSAELVPPKGADGGGFVLRIERQTAVGKVNGDGTRTRPSFGGGPVSFFLTVNQAAHLLAVLEGRSRSICGGKGVFCNIGGKVGILHCDAVTEAAGSFYAVHIIERDGAEIADGRISLNAAEASALSKAVNSSMGVAAFGNGNGGAR